MTDHPLLYTSDMVIRILTCAKCGKISIPFPCEHCGSEEFCKTQTRRVPVERYRDWKVGEMIWGKETLDEYEIDDVQGTGAIYDADAALVGAGWQWRRGKLPAIFMPKWAARIWLEITGLRDERVQEIDAKDALAEGIWKGDKRTSEVTIVHRFRNLWDSINAKRHNGIYAWDKNPMTKVIKFKRVQE